MFYPYLLNQYFDHTVSGYPQKIALIYGNERWSYLKLFHYAEILASTLSRLGAKSQDRVIIFLDNCPLSVISMYGILKGGGIFIILNGSLKHKKLAYIINDAGANIIITHTRKARIVTAALELVNNPVKILWDGPSDRIPHQTASVSESVETIFSGVSQISSLPHFPENLQQPSIIDIDLASLIYTSGSTGEPKGVMSSHRNMISAAQSIIKYLDNRPEDVILNVLPLSFDYGLYQVIMSMLFGGTIVLEKSFQYLHEVLTVIDQEQVTAFPIVPTILAMILRLQNLNQYKINTLRYLSNTGAALPVDHILKFRELFPDVQIFSMYGLTECKRVSYLQPGLIDKKPASVGKAMPNCETRIVDNNGEDVKPGETGELIVRGSNVMLGYWNAPKLTARYFKQNHDNGETILYSGDLFRMDDDGDLYFVGRKDDMIKSRGERLSAREIENAIYDCEGVTEVAVLGIPDELFGQAIKAVIVIDADSKITEKDIGKFCTQNLEPAAVPKAIEIVPALPRTANGKIDKSKLIEKTSTNRS